MSKTRDLEVKRLTEMLALLEKTADLICRTTPTKSDQGTKSQSDSQSRSEYESKMIQEGIVS